MVIDGDCFLKDGFDVTTGGSGEEVYVLAAPPPPPGLSVSVACDDSARTPALDILGGYSGYTGEVYKVSRRSGLYKSVRLLQLLPSQLPVSWIHNRFGRSLQTQEWGSVRSVCDASSDVVHTGASATTSTPTPASTEPAVAAAAATVSRNTVCGA